MRLEGQKVTYLGMPFGMWTMFAGSFQKQLTVAFGYDVDTAKTIKKKAKPKYREIISELPEFEKGDRFKMNLVNCAMIGAFILSMPQRPEVDRLTDYYARSMMMPQVAGCPPGVPPHCLSRFAAFQCHLSADLGELL